MFGSQRANEGIKPCIGFAILLLVSYIKEGFEPTTSSSTIFALISSCNGSNLTGKQVKFDYITQETFFIKCNKKPSNKHNIPSLDLAIFSNPVVNHFFEN